MVPILKQFWQSFKKLFQYPVLQRLKVFIEQPRMFIWLIICGYISLFPIFPLMGQYPILVILLLPVGILQVLFTIFIFQYIIPVELVLRFCQGVRRVATQTEKERILPLFEDVYNHVKQKNPYISKKVKIYIVDNMETNAFIIGRNTLAITRGAMQTFDDEELKGVMAHEFGHLAYGDGQKALLIQLCTSGYLWIFLAVTVLLDYLISLCRNELIKAIPSLLRWIVSLVLKVTLFVFTLIISGGSRKQEYRADLYASNLGYGKELKNALYKLYDMQVSDQRGLIKRLQRSHPILAYRIEKLENE